MTFLELTDVQKRFGDDGRRRGLQPRGRARRVRLVPRAVRLRQDDDAADDRRLRAADRPARSPIDGVDITYRPPNQRNVGHGLPVLRPVPEHDRRRQHRLRAQGPQAAEGRTSSAGRRAARAHQPARQGRPLSRTSCRAASSSAWRSPARSRSSRRSCSSTSRCRRSTPRSGSPCARRSATIQRQLGITTVYVTHDQEEALSLSDRVVVMSEGRIEQIGTPSEIYNFPATPFVASFVGTLNLVAANGRRRRRPDACRVDGQEVRAAKPITEARNGVDGHARPPARERRARRGRRLEPAPRHGRGRQLPRLDRPDPGPASGTT